MSILSAANAATCCAERPPSWPLWRVQRLARLLLTSAGHSVICAADAETGLKLARELQPALILMDIQLPGMDGLKATSLLKKDALTSAIPVIFVIAGVLPLALALIAIVAGRMRESEARHPLDVH